MQIAKGNHPWMDPKMLIDWSLTVSELYVDSSTYYSSKCGIFSISYYIIHLVQYVVVVAYVAIDKAYK